MTEPDDDLVHDEFTNTCGERWQVAIDPVCHNGVLTGDELGDEEVEIWGGCIGGGLCLNDEEFRWLSEVWLQATGQTLAPTFQQHLEKALLAMGGDFRNN